MNTVVSDLIDQLIVEWQAQRADLNPHPMGVVGRILLLANAMAADTSRALKPFALQYTEFDVLATLRRKGPPYRLNPKQLLASVLITSGAMTACVDRLARRGYVERIADPDDRRGRIIQLTDVGRTLVDQAVKARFQLAARSIAGLSEKEQTQLAKLLAKLMAQDRGTH
jgi:DNA-binding MarR family transcriptional regulator